MESATGTDASSAPRHFYAFADYAVAIVRATAFTLQDVIR